MTKEMEIKIPVRADYFSLHYTAHTTSRAHLASFPMGTRGSFLRREVPGV
jgi:hypothetical protein